MRDTPEGPTRPLLPPEHFLDLVDTSPELTAVVDGSREINGPGVVVIVCRSFGWPW